jgi:hypothetical protein
MEGIFLVAAVIAFAEFALSLLFPSVRIAPRRSTTDDATPPE